eukprot:1898555-Amphidinium_carterae.1
MSLLRLKVHRVTSSQRTAKGGRSRGGRCPQKCFLCGKQFIMCTVFPFKSGYEIRMYGLWPLCRCLVRPCVEEC